MKPRKPMPRAERFTKNIPEGRETPCRENPFSYRQSAFSGRFCFSCRTNAKATGRCSASSLFPICATPPIADAGRDHRRDQLCSEHGSLLLSGKQEQLSERENHVRRAVRHAGDGADFHLGRLVVDSAGGREYCGDGRRVYVQSEEDPPRGDVC